MTTDSAGVVIVSNPAPGPDLPVWRVALDSPVVTIGGVDDPALDVNLGLTAVSMRDGTILVSDEHEYPLRAFDRGGPRS